MKPPSMNHSDCTEALHAVKRQCSPDDTRCLLSHGVEVEDCPLPLTSCIAAGGSEQVRVCLTRPTEQVQTVYGLGMRGVPTRGVFS